jgi:hypothetical protein
MNSTEAEQWKNQIAIIRSSAFHLDVSPPTRGSGSPRQCWRAGHGVRAAAEGPAFGHRQSYTQCEEDAAVDALVERLDARLREWKPETAAQVRQCMAEVIELADQDVLDVMHPRATEQEVLDLLDEPTTR